MSVVFDGTSIVLSYTAGNTSSQTFRPERYPTARYVTAGVPETLDADPRTDLMAPPAEECSAEVPEPGETAARPTAEPAAEAPGPGDLAAPPAAEADARVPAAEETATLSVEEPAAEETGPEGLAAPPATELSAEDQETEETEAPEPEETAARPEDETFQTM